MEKITDEELYNLHSSSNVNVMKSKMLSWERHVAYMGEVHIQTYLESLKQRDIVEKCDKGRMILKGLLNKYSMRIWAQFMWFW